MNPMDNAGKFREGFSKEGTGVPAHTPKTNSSPCISMDGCFKALSSFFFFRGYYITYF